MAQPKAYSYIRFSTPEQAKGDSLRRQEKLAEEFAKRNGFDLDDSLKMADKGFSAFHGTHKTKGALGGFLKLVEKGEVPKGSVLIVENLDRLSREQVLDALNQFTSIIRAGIKVVTLQDNMEYSEQSINNNFGQLLMSIVYMSRAHEESLAKSKRIQEAWKSKRERARSENLKLTARCPGWLILSEDKTKFSVIPERVEAIKRIYQMKLEGIGNGTIEKMLNQDPKVWKPEKGWRTSYIIKILHNNRAVIGEHQPYHRVNGKRVPDGNPIQNYFPKVIEKEIFDRVQAVIQRNRKTKGNAGGRTAMVSNLFAHIAVCRQCGSPAVLINKGKPPKGYPYLVCDKARRGIGCSKNFVRYDKLEALILTYCKGLEVSEILPESQDLQTELSIQMNTQERKEGAVIQIQNQLENILDSIVNTDDKQLRKVMEERASTLLKEQEVLKKELEELKSNIKNLTNIREESEKQIENIQELIRLMPTYKDEERIRVRLNLRNQLRRLISKIYLFNKRDSYNSLVYFRTGLRRLIICEKEGVRVLDARSLEKLPNPPEKLKSMDVNRTRKNV